MKKTLIVFSGILALIYLMNPTFGIFELIPDNIPIIGNLDEGAAAYLLLSVISYLLGKDIGLFNTDEPEIES